MSSVMSSNERATVKATSRNRTQAAAPARNTEAIRKAALRIVEAKPVPAHVFDTRLQRAASIGEKASRTARADLTEGGFLAVSRREPKPGGGCFVGTPEQVETLHREWRIA